MSPTPTIEYSIVDVDIPRQSLGSRERNPPIIDREHDVVKNHSHVSMRLIFVLSSPVSQQT
jgi:hypothetical protein